MKFQKRESKFVSVHISIKYAKSMSGFTQFAVFMFLCPTAYLAKLPKTYKVRAPLYPLKSTILLYMFPVLLTNMHNIWAGWKKAFIKV